MNRVCKHKYGEYRRIIFTKCYGDQGRVVKTCVKCGMHKEMSGKLESAIRAIVG